MIKKLLHVLITLFLIIFPFVGGWLISPFTPYTDGNSLAVFLLAYALVLVLVSLLLLYIIKRYKQPFIQPVQPAILLFYFGCVLLCIAGLAAGPDLSVKMLQHPEREHTRYLILLAGALLFGWFFLSVLSNGYL